MPVAASWAAIIMTCPLIAPDYSLHYSNNIAGFKKLQREQLEKSNHFAIPSILKAELDPATRPDCQKIPASTP